MPVLGIDITKCSKCLLCVKDCPTGNFSVNSDKQELIFNDSNCILCGHCIAVCPEDAILDENMMGEALEFGVTPDPNTLINYRGIHRLLRGIRSIRQYQPTSVPKELIHNLIDTMRYAPAGANMRNLKCLVVSGKQQRAELTEAIINALEVQETRDLFRTKFKQGQDPIFYHAPHIFILYSKNPWDTRNVTIAMTYGMITAKVLGLGSCWIGYAHGILADNPGICRRLTGIQTYVLGVMTIGYPSVTYYRAPPRPPIDIREI
ncbi:MAG: nitroreductase family protein [Promethearchaeota archaeon]|jgi:nitroreductase/Pyruvate/2-oxoacid:ferredoxin oxidoreductase delta subunit